MPGVKDARLAQAVAALRAGRKVAARRLLEDVLHDDPGSERGWLWLADTLDVDEERRFCLAQALSINRRNALARRGLEALGPGQARSPLSGRQSGAARSKAARTWIAAVRDRPFLLALGYLFALTGAEFLTLVIDPQIGLWGYSALLIVLILHAALIWRRPFYKFFLSLALAPLIRLVSLTMPLSGLPLIYWYPITSVPLMAATWLIARLAGFTPRQIGLNRPQILPQMLIGSSGLLFGYVEYRLLRPAPLVKAATWGDLLLPALILLICTGLVEELIFRGIMQRAATEVLGNPGLVYVSGLFAMLHMGHASQWDIPFVFAVGLIFSWAVNKTRSIWGVTLAHGLTNVMLFLIMPALAQSGK
ncbi:MAG: CPBP family intramembrane metalloprotease [Anaerolineae bacterium]|nr:CPBP family intramembrane metalloprotease [Anaerolineae bacterium]